MQSLLEPLVEISHNLVREEEVSFLKPLSSCQDQSTLSASSAGRTPEGFHWTMEEGSCNLPGCIA